MASDTSPPQPKNARQLVLKAAEYTAVPNWLFDVCLRVIPYEATHLLLYLVRKTVGYTSSDGTVEMSLIDLERETGIGGDTISRWAHAFSYVGLIQYMPARNSAKKSSFTVFPHGLPTMEQVRAICSGIASAREQESKSARLSAERFGELVRKHTIHWSTKLMEPDARRDLMTKISGERKGLV